MEEKEIKNKIHDYNLKIDYYQSEIKKKQNELQDVYEFRGHYENKNNQINEVIQNHARNIESIDDKKIKVLKGYKTVINDHFIGHERNNLNQLMQNNHQQITRSINKLETEIEELRHDIHNIGNIISDLEYDLRKIQNS